MHKIGIFHPGMNDRRSATGYYIVLLHIRDGLGSRFNSLLVVLAVDEDCIAQSHWINTRQKCEFLLVSLHSKSTAEKLSMH